jgi:hypothetical protein
MSDRRLRIFQLYHTIRFLDKNWREQQFKLPQSALKRMGCLMIQKLIENSVECFAHATEAQRRSDMATDPASKREFDDMAGRWRRLAESYQFVERVDDFLDNKVMFRR